MTSVNSRQKILVTGAAGFVGSHLARRLVKEGYDVNIIIRSSTDLQRIKDILPNLNCHIGDLSDFSGLSNIIKKIEPMGVFHLAVSTIMSGVTAAPEEVIRNNFLGTANLVNAVSEINYRFFINTGSFLEYGVKKRAVKESEPCEPLELYSITKLAGTFYCKTVAKAKNKPIITFRLFTPYGPFIQKGRLVYQVITNALQNKDINLSRPNLARDFIFVDDLVDLYMEAMEKAATHKGEIFNAASGIRTSLKTLVNCVLKISGPSSKINWNAFRDVVYDSDTWQADMDKTFGAFIWRPKYGLEDGLRKSIQWFRINDSYATS